MSEPFHTSRKIIVGNTWGEINGYFLRPRILPASNRQKQKVSSNSSEHSLKRFLVLGRQGVRRKET